MNTQKRILIAFALNLLFSTLELIGGLWTGSIAILSDAFHDLADAASIGLAFFLEKKSHRPPDQTHTYGYGRYSLLGGVITSAVLLFGSGLMICSAARRIFCPIPINYDGMILLALAGTGINLAAALVTRNGHSMNQRAVSLHMLEDVFGWVAVLAGAVVMRLTHFSPLDPLLSIGVSVFILINAAKNLRCAADIFLLKTPREISLPQLQAQLQELDGVAEVHHLHISRLNEGQSIATVHIVTDRPSRQLKEAAEQVLARSGICHATVETELPGETCRHRSCEIRPAAHSHHHHH